MIFALFIVLGVSILVYYIIYKMWSSAVKTIGSKIIGVLKPIYKFMFKVFPITIVIITAISIVFAAYGVIYMIRGNNQMDDNKENTEVVEETEYKQDKSFIERAIERSVNRTENFMDGLFEKIEAFNKSIGVDGNGESNETPEFGIKYILVVAYGITLIILFPFIIILLIIVVSIVMILELLAATFIIDTVILIIRLVFAENAMEKVTCWWEWAKE